ncbi:hypothetical protein IIO_01899 [Bacillus cereus VD115]|nr:hypothetical protein IIO_01899 [Bacillus cereus VD115]
MKKVLIIEDEKIIRETVAQYFSHDAKYGVLFYFRLEKWDEK